MRTKLYEIPGRMISEWDPEGKAVIDTVKSYFMTLDEFKTAVMIKGVNHAKLYGGIAWIVDSSHAKGAFAPEIQKYIETDVFPKFAEIGIKYFMTINSTDSVARLTVNEFSSKVGPHGIKLLKGSSVSGAIDWLKKNT